MRRHFIASRRNHGLKRRRGVDVPARLRGVGIGQRAGGRLVAGRRRRRVGKASEVVRRRHRRQRRTGPAGRRRRLYHERALGNNAGGLRREARTGGRAKRRQRGRRRSRGILIIGERVVALGVAAPLAADGADDAERETARAQNHSGTCNADPGVERERTGGVGGGVGEELLRRIGRKRRRRRGRRGGERAGGCRVGRGGGAEIYKQIRRRRRRGGGGGGRGGARRRLLRIGRRRRRRRLCIHNNLLRGRGQRRRRPRRRPRRGARRRARRRRVALGGDKFARAADHAVGAVFVLAALARAAEARRGRGAVALVAAGEVAVSQTCIDRAELYLCRRDVQTGQQQSHDELCHSRQFVVVVVAMGNRKM